MSPKRNREEIIKKGYTDGKRTYENIKETEKTKAHSRRKTKNGRWKRQETQKKRRTLIALKRRRKQR